VTWGLGLQIIATLVIKWASAAHTQQHLLSSSLASSANPRRSSIVSADMGTPGDAIATSPFAVAHHHLRLRFLRQSVPHGLMQQIIKAVAWICSEHGNLRRQSQLTVAASILRPDRSPAHIRPFLSGATRSELCVILTPAWPTSPAGIWPAYMCLALMRKIYSPPSS